MVRRLFQVVFKVAAADFAVAFDAYADLVEHILPFGDMARRTARCYDREDDNRRKVYDEAGHFMHNKCKVTSLPANRQTCGAV